MHVSASYRVLVTVLGGLHRGAVFVGQGSQGVLLGQQEDCDLVLLDEGVSGRAANLLCVDGHLVVEALTEGLLLDGQAMPAGRHAVDTPAVVLRVGQAELRAELLRRSRQANAMPAASWAAPASATAPRRSTASLALAGLSLVAALSVAGAAVNATGLRQASAPAATLASVVEAFNARGAHLALQAEPDGRHRLTGLVAHALMADELQQALDAASLKATLQLRDVQQMADSLTRLARLTGHTCEARHVAQGRFECDAGLVDAATLTRLQALPTQVPGVVGLVVHAQVPAAKPQPAADVAALATAQVAAPAVPVRVEAPPAAPPWPVIRHVAIGAREGLAFDAQGRKLRVGDEVAGARVERIRLESVDLLRDGQRHTVGVTPVLASAATGTSAR